MNTTTEKLPEIYLDLYKHHFELYLKGFFIHLVVVGAISGFLFATESPAVGNAAIALASMGLVVTIVGLLGSILAFVWAFRMRSVCLTMCNKLSIEPPPMFGGIATTILLMMGSVGLIVTSCYLLHSVIKGTL